MRIPSSSEAARFDTDLHAAHGQKERSHAAGAHDEHARSPSASSAANGASGPDSNSHDAALRQAFNVALGAVAFQIGNSEMAAFQDAMAETDEDT
ncbi:hypothetical protein [Bradyrhizobium sp. Cp5.3]|uniref:hypothetical protein n=1 Tax=Bradyrhizobium sp. Cp5.3 TaxID=443598 RepID=UPI0012EC9B7E|nr:hypothetical protein [Bradyrhizobium sp. Cp5.3]